MDKTTSPYCLYEEGEVIDDAEHIVFEFRVCLLAELSLFTDVNNWNDYSR